MEFNREAKLYILVLRTLGQPDLENIPIKAQHKQLTDHLNIHKKFGKKNLISLVSFIQRMFLLEWFRIIDSIGIQNIPERSTENSQLSQLGQTKFAEKLFWEKVWKSIFWIWKTFEWKTRASKTNRPMN